MLRPLGANVLVRVEEKKESTGGLTLPESAKNRQVQSGIVVDCGEGRWDVVNSKFVPYPFSKGSRLLFAPNAGKTVEHDGGNYQVLGEQDILLWVQESSEST